MYLKNTKLIVFFIYVTFLSSTSYLSTYSNHPSYPNQSFNLSFMLPNITSTPVLEIYGPIIVDCDDHKSPRLLYPIVIAKTVFSGR